jgi:hypothetical protein
MMKKIEDMTREEYDAARDGIRLEMLTAALDPSHERWGQQRFRAAHTIDIIVRKDGKEYRYEGDFLKDVARVLIPSRAGFEKVCDVPTELGAVTGLSVERGKVVAQTESGVKMIVPNPK